MSKLISVMIETDSKSGHARLSLTVPTSGGNVVLGVREGRSMIASWISLEPWQQRELRDALSEVLDTTEGGSMEGIGRVGEGEEFPKVEPGPAGIDPLKSSRSGWTRSEDTGFYTLDGHPGVTLSFERGVGTEGTWMLEVSGRQNFPVNHYLNLAQETVEAFIQQKVI